MNKMIILFALSLSFMFAGEGPKGKDIEKLKQANDKVWLTLLKNPDAYLVDWKSVDLKVLAEKVDDLNEEIKDSNQDPWKLDASAVQVINQIRLINSRNYRVQLEKPQPVRYRKNYFSSID